MISIDICCGYFNMLRPMQTRHKMWIYQPVILICGILTL